MMGSSDPLIERIAAHSWLRGASKIAFDGDIEFLHIDHNLATNPPLGDDEVFVTTSWWSTSCVLPIIEAHRVYYLFQEDERMFYAFGDDRLRCLEVLSNPHINYVVNSKLLFDHLTQGTEPLSNIQRNGVWFEPAFPASDRTSLRNREPAGRWHFLFYARPNNLRNLYWRGLEAITAAIEENVLDPANWDFHFVGKDLESIKLPRGVTPMIGQNLPWREYNSLIRTIDVGLSLMDTPHPSYPPLDLAAAGAIAVTSRHGNKVSLESYSSSIICAEPTVAGLVAGLSEAVGLADDLERRQRNLETDRINRYWGLALEETLQQVCRNLRAA